MKKKIALLLAAVMTLSALPTMSIFATTANTFGNFTNLPAKSLLVQHSGFSGDLASENDTLEVKYVSTTKNFQAKLSDDPENNLNEGDRFSLQLTNADWFFAKGTDVKNVLDELVSSNTFNTTYVERDKVTSSFPNAKNVANLNAYIAVVEAQINAIKNVADNDDVVAIEEAFDEFDAAHAVFNAKFPAGSDIDILAYGTAAAAEFTALKATGAPPADPTVYTNAKALAAAIDLSTEKADAQVAALAADEALVSSSFVSFATKLVATENEEFYTEGNTNIYTKIYGFVGANTDPQFVLEVEENNKSIAVVTILDTISRNTSFLLPACIRFNDKDEDVTLVPGNEGNMSSNAVTINKVSNTTGTNTTVEAETGRDKINVKDISIKETTPGILKSGGYVTLSIDKDFEWDKDNLDVAYSTTALVGGANTGVWLNPDKNELTIMFDFTRKGGNPVAATITLKGLVVRPTEDTEDSGYYGQDVKMKIKSVTSYTKEDGTTVKNVKESGVREQSGILLGSFKDFGISLAFDSSSAKPKEAYSGKKDIEGGMKGDDLAEIKLAEITTKSWWATSNLEFTLTDAEGNQLDGVKFASFNINKYENVTFPSNYSPKMNGGRDKVTVTSSSEIPSTKLGNMKFEVKINTAANFVGDVYLNIAGRALEKTEMIAEPLKIATISAPIKVTTKTTSVAIGYQSYAVADITITEAAPAVLAKGKDITFNVREFAELTSAKNSEISFNPLASDAVKRTAGDIEFEKVKVNKGSNTIALQVKRESKEASTFTLSGLKISINRSVPFGKYDLVVGGDAWVETFDDPDDDTSHPEWFDIDGLIEKDYVAVVTEPSTAVVSRNIVVFEGTNTAEVDGSEVEMGAATFIDTASNRMMLPLRAISALFGISDDKVIWDPTSSRATIIIGDRMVSFVTGSSIMTINGVEVDMVDENGVAVKATINPENERMYIPLRQLGLAYGIEVLWIPSTPGQAIFNPTADQKEEAANTTPAVAAADAAEDAAADAADSAADAADSAAAAADAADAAADAADSAEDAAE